MKKKYLVIGLYASGQRYADEFSADTPQDAENQAIEQVGDITVAGTIELKKGMVIEMAS